MGFRASISNWETEPSETTDGGGKERTTHRVELLELNPNLLRPVQVKSGPFAELVAVMEGRIEGRLHARLRRDSISLRA
jgi:hypothetical protein